MRKRASLHILKRCFGHLPQCWGSDAEPRHGAKYCITWSYPQPIASFENMLSPDYCPGPSVYSSDTLLGSSSQPRMCKFRGGFFLVCAPEAPSALTDYIPSVFDSPGSSLVFLLVISSVTCLYLFSHFNSFNAKKKEVPLCTIHYLSTPLTSCPSFWLEKEAFNPTSQCLYFPAI